MTQFEYSKQAYILWAEEFINKHKYFPRSGDVTVARNGAPGGLAYLKTVFGGMWKFKQACHEAGLSCDYTTSKGGSLAALRPYINDRLYHTLSSKSNLSWPMVERLLDQLGLHPQVSAFSAS